MEVERAGLAGFEADGAGEADSLALGLGDMDDAGGVGAAVADGLDGVDKGDGGEAAEDEPAGYVLERSAAGVLNEKEAYVDCEAFCYCLGGCPYGLGVDMSAICPAKGAGGKG